MGFLHDMYGARGRVLGEQLSATIVGDKQGYVSPMDRTVVEGRTAHREHMRKHGVLEAGDMKMGEFSGRERSAMPSVAGDIKRAIQECSR